MQNKGLVKILAITMVILSLWYLSFTVVSSIYSRQAKEYAKGDPMKEIKYLDSLSNKKVWFNYTLKEVRDQEIGLGLDLKGGMNVILELNVEDVLRTLSGNSDNPDFLKALEAAKEKKVASQKDFISLFIDEFHKVNPGGRLAAIFSTLDLRDRISPTASDAQVEKVLRAETNEAIDSSFKVLRNRIDRFGVVSPNIQKLETNGRILVELPGVKEPDRVRKLLQGAAKLEFWETASLAEVYGPLTRIDNILAAKHNNSKDTTADEQQTKKNTESTATVTSAKTDIDSLKAKVAEATAALDQENSNSSIDPAQLAQIREEHPLFAYLQPALDPSGRPSNSPVVGFARAADIHIIDSLLTLPSVKGVLSNKIKLAWSAKPMSENGNIYQLFALKSNNRDGSCALTGDVVTEAQADINTQSLQGSSRVGVSMTMNKEGAKEWARLTRSNIGHSIAIVLDGLVYSAPNVNSEIPNGRSSISGNFTVDEANDLANTLKSGKMAASVNIVQEDVVGPSLGKEAIKAGVVSFIIALIILMIYMCVIYGFLPGMVVNGALFLNLLFTLGILSSFNAVLTLAGIAGMVLTLAMAVDANVLIFERIKEELEAGKNMMRAIKDGYGNAFSAILDSNVTTIVTGLILFFFGTGPIRGFATTLIIGLICSFMTAVFITRLVFDTLGKKGKMDKITFTTGVSRNLFKRPNFDFLSRRKVSFTIFGAYLIAGLIAFFTIGLNAGIDFTGGRNYVVKFDKVYPTNEVAKQLNPVFDGSVRVINIGTPDQVRISTNYRINDNTSEIDREIEQKLFEGLKPMLAPGTTQDQFRDQYIQSSQKVGATMADDIKEGALIAVCISLIFIALYILIRFRDIAFSAGAFLSVTVNTFVIIATYALIWKLVPFSMEVDTTFIAALLAIIGYSINDTVVVFDRIRETLGLYPNRGKYEVFNDALNSTLARTFNTSLTTLLTILVIFILGGPTIRSFTFAMLVGVLVGTFTTLFIASPVAYLVASRKKKSSTSK